MIVLVQFDIDLRHIVKMTDQLANQAAEQLKLYEKQKAQTERKLDASKHQQSTTLQEKLNARLKKKEDKSKQKAEQDEKNSLQKSGMIKVLIL